MQDYVIERRDSSGRRVTATVVGRTVDVIVDRKAKGTFPESWVAAGFSTFDSEEAASKYAADALERMEELVASFL